MKGAIIYFRIQISVYSHSSRITFLHAHYTSKGYSLWRTILLQETEHCQRLGRLHIVGHILLALLYIVRTHFKMR